MIYNDNGLEYNIFVKGNDFLLTGTSTEVIKLLMKRIEILIDAGSTAQIDVLDDSISIKNPQGELKTKLNQAAHYGINFLKDVVVEEKPAVAVFEVGTEGSTIEVIKPSSKYL